MKKNNSNENYFAVNLKYLRQKNNMEQLELANLLGRKSSSSVSEWEKGKYTPKAGVLNDIAKIFSIPLSKLMNENLSEQSITILDKINQISSELEEPRQKIVLETATDQLDEQKLEQNKVKQIEDYRLSDEYLEEQISKASAYGGGQLNDNDKEFFKRLLKNTLKEKIDKGDL